jgi:hypothetical protein
MELKLIYRFVVQKDVNDKAGFEDIKTYGLKNVLLDLGKHHF